MLLSLVDIAQSQSNQYVGLNWNHNLTFSSALPDSHLQASASFYEPFNPRVVTASGGCIFINRLPWNFFRDTDSGSHYQVTTFVHNPFKLEVLFLPKQVPHGELLSNTKFDFSLKTQPLGHSFHTMILRKPFSQRFCVSNAGFILTIAAFSTPVSTVPVT